jgi:N-carbamoyl-D-amino-acid hydrolase
MSRKIIVGAAQLGPIARNENRCSVVARLLELMREAKARGCHFIVYPELALTTFFPRWYFPTQPEVDAWFEREMPGPETQVLFDEARRLEMGFYLGYAEIAEEADGTHHYNTAIMVNAKGDIVGKYRKVHLPGHREHEPWRAFQHLEKRYFECGNLGFPAYRAQVGGHDGIFGMALCNDRRWPETHRVLGLQGVEMSFIGYNTPIHYPQVPEHDHLQAFHNLLPMQAGAYQNGMWIVGVAKAGKEENLRPAWAELHHRADRRGCRHVFNDRRRTGNGVLRPRPLQGDQGQRVQLRAAPGTAALPVDRRDERGDRAALRG